MTDRTDTPSDLTCGRCGAGAWGHGTPQPLDWPGGGGAEGVTPRTDTGSGVAELPGLCRARARGAPRGRRRDRRRRAARRQTPVLTEAAVPRTRPGDGLMNSPVLWGNGPPDEGGAVAGACEGGLGAIPDPPPPPHHRPLPHSAAPPDVRRARLRGRPIGQPPNRR